jgi:hypothetical protein
MFYTFSYTPVITDTETAPHALEMPLTAGIIHQVDVLFQSGSNHKIFVRIMRGGQQLWPSNREEKLRGDATIVSFRDFIPLEPGETKMRALIYTTLTADFKEVLIQIGVLPREILQPLSFEAIVKAIAGIEKS